MLHQGIILVKRLSSLLEVMASKWHLKPGSLTPESMPLTMGMKGESSK